ncbi:methionine ABC transporter ATP-binding protein [Anaerovorax odorimutans]|uniref:methionine ABC transporter ATP-binding protein n=1 Tax=Anaerovorax odorimutans TaxID=109327 RepID=UPI0004091FD0|nr:ATP-binding cassette domain-containing protein [Anaerovorax odorimutans]
MAEDEKINKDSIIEIVGLSKTFKTKNSEVNALKDINLTINKGDVFGIIGMSGAGKSTLVRCMNFLERPTEGKVLFDGRDLFSMSAIELRRTRQEIGMIFQQFNLLMQRTVEENICFPMEIAKIDKSKQKARVKELLEIVDLSDKINAYPSQLSGGQKQRVAIARALATNPKVLLCDEATSALDPKTTRSILALLKDINKRLDITIIIITHEMSVIEEICSHVAIIDNSQIAEYGTVEEIFSHPKTQSAKRLVHPDGELLDFHGQAGKHVRIVFNGNSSFEPVISNMVLKCKAPVNIMFADTKNIDGKAFGQMIVQLPEDNTLSDKMINYLKTQNVELEEVYDFV